MCMSKPKIPDNKTPPAPNAPEAAPDAFALNDNARYQMLRARGLTIPEKPDLSGLGNQAQGKPLSTLLIRPEQNTPVNVEAQLAAEDARVQAATTAANYRKPAVTGGTHQTPGAGYRGN